MIKIGVHGANGRMGRTILQCLEEEPKAKATSAYDKNKIDIDIFKSNLDSFFKNCDVIIDFTLNSGTKELLKYALNNPKSLCIGTTGLDHETITLLKECSLKMPILYATNMSLGVAILNKLAFLASKALNDYDAEIVEMHHRHKKDAPSGTALTLGEFVAKARELDINKVRVNGRDGDIGERSKDEIAIMSLRGGDIVGKHTAGFYTDGEFIEISHTATSRTTFAKGAIKAAIWVSSQKSGLYSINDCLGI